MRSRINDVLHDHKILWQLGGEKPDLLNYSAARKEAKAKNLDIEIFLAEMDKHRERWARNS